MQKNRRKKHNISYPWVGNRKYAKGNKNNTGEQINNLSSPTYDDSNIHYCLDCMYYLMKFRDITGCNISIPISLQCPSHFVLFK